MLAWPETVPAVPLFPSEERANVTTTDLRHHRTNDVDFAYRRAGTGDPLVFLHGLGMTRRWLPIHAALAERFDMIAPEHPGFGDTPRPQRLCGHDAIVAAECALLHDLDVPRFHLVGHSAGALLAAMLTVAEPERVRSLTLITPSPLPVATPAEFMPTPPPPGTDFDQLLFNGNAASYPAFLNGGDNGNNYEAAAAGEERVDPPFDMFDAPALHTQLNRITCPRQVLIPDEDRIFDLRCFDVWAHALGDVPIVRITGTDLPTGHLLIVQEPEAITTAVAALAATA